MIRRHLVRALRRPLLKLIDLAMSASEREIARVRELRAMTHQSETREHARQIGLQARRQQIERT